MPIVQILMTTTSGGGGGGTPQPTSTEFYGQQWLYNTTGSTPSLAPAGANYNVTVANATPTAVTFGDGTTGYVSNFNGTQMWASGNLNAGGLMTSTYSIAIDMWIYPTANSVMILSEQDNWTGPSWFASVLEINSNNTVTGRLWSGAPLTSTDTVTLNAWNHIYLYYDHANLQLGLRVNNGTAVVSNAYSRASNYAGGGNVFFVIGETHVTSYNSGRYQGHLGELRINNWMAPSSYWSDAKKYLNLGGTIVSDANLKFDLQGTTAPSVSNTWDSTVNGRSATLYNSPTYNSGSGYYTFSNPSYASLSGESNNLGTINTTPAQTMTMWAKVTQADQYQAIAGFRPEGQNNFYLLLLSPSSGGSPTYGTEFRVSTVNTQVDNVQPYINLFGRWTHITCVADNTTTRIYFNSKLAGTASITGNFGSNTASFDIASSNWYSAGTSMAEIQFYNKALSQAEIERNYATNKLRLGL